MNSPTTTGGRPMPVFAPASTTRRPGNRVSATAAPSGSPMSSATAVADRDTRSVSAVIDQVSSSPVSSNRTALARPPSRTSNGHPSEVSWSAAQRGLVHAGVRGEQRLAEPVPAELSHELLGGGRDDPVGEGGRAVGPDPVAGLRRHLDHVVDVEQARVAL